MRAGVARGGPEAVISPHSPPDVIRDVAVGLPGVQGGEEEAQGEVPLPYHAPQGRIPAPPAVPGCLRPDFTGMPVLGWTQADQHHLAAHQQCPV